MLKSWHPGTNGHKMAAKKLGFGATICKMVRPMLLDHCLGCSVGNDTVLWPNGWMDQDGTEPGTMC